MDKKKSEDEPFFNKAFGQLIEMAYWMVKFEGDFNNNYEKSGKSTEEKSDSTWDWDFFPDRLFGENSRTYIKFIRYFLKFFGSFEKLLKVVQWHERREAPAIIEVWNKKSLKENFTFSFFNAPASFYLVFCGKGIWSLIVYLHTWQYPDLIER